MTKTKEREVRAHDQVLSDARHVLEKAGYSVVRKSVHTARLESARETLEHEGYVVLKKKSYEDTQRKRQRAEALLSAETQHQKGLYAWMDQHFAEERRLRDRLVFVYGVARAHGATVAELHSPEGSIQEAEQGEGLITEITIPELVVRSMTNGVYEDTYDPETDEVESQVVPGTEDFGTITLFVPVESLHLLPFNKPVDLTVKVAQPETRDISTREPENQSAPMEPEGCLVTDCRNGHTHVCVRPQDHDGSHDFSCSKCDEDAVQPSPLYDTNHPEGAELTWNRDESKWEWRAKDYSESIVAEDGGYRPIIGNPDIVTEPQKKGEDVSGWTPAGWSGADAESRDISTMEPQNQPPAMNPEEQFAAAKPVTMFEDEAAWCSASIYLDGLCLCVRPQGHDGAHDFSDPKAKPPEGEVCRLCLETGCTGGCVDPETAEELEDQLNNRFDEDDDFGMEPDDD